LEEKLVQLEGFIGHKNTPYGRVEGLQLLMEIIIDISKNYERHFENTDSHFPKINNAIVMMKKNFRRVITLEELASVAGLPSRTFTRQFKIITNNTPIGYLTKIRLDHAKDYLENSNLSISEIAFKCGFTDSNYFTKSFKAQCHISPREWRNNSRERKFVPPL
jgi:transcriptional regulator GlxA family with amidase domain